MSGGGKYGQLVVISRSGGDGKAFPMHTTRVLIGRKETCDIRMQRAHVSKEHCVIRVIDNEVVLKNLSENCTSVNTHVLEAGQQRALKSGDVITIVGRSLRFEENASTSATPQGPSHVPSAPQTVGAPNGVVRPPLVFASGGGDVQRQLRRRLGRTPRNPDTARKLELWEAHYSGSKSTGPLDIGEESPPPTLVASRQSLADSDDPFAASADGEEKGVFERMAQSVGRGGAEGARREEVSAEVARIMGQISDMARITTTPLLSSRKRPRSPAEDVGNERRRSRSLERMEPGAQQQQQEHTPLLRQKPTPVGAGALAVYGSEDETSRATLAVSPQSTYSRSPTLQRQRRGTPSATAAAVVVAVQRSKPLQRAGSLSTARAPEGKRALTPAPFYSSLPQPAYSSVGASRRAVSNGSSPTRPAGQSSPLKRTLSSNSAVATRRPPPNPLPPALPTSDSDEEVPTEPEPESDGEPPAVVERTTPERKRPVLVTQESIARKSVRFGPALSPEVFDVAAPPSTPLRRGTPMQMAGRASSSILRRSSPTRHTAPRAPSPVSPPSLLLGSLLTPRPSRRQAMHQYIASLSALAESPAFEKPPPPQQVPEEELIELRNHDEDPREELQEPENHDDEPMEEPMEPAVDIQSPAVLSPEDRRQRRRRSVRLAATHRRATLDSPLRKESPLSSSPLLVVRRAVESPTKRPIISLSAQRRERRRTAPAISTDFRAEMAEMAAALGEDVPTLFAQKKVKEKEETAAPVIEAEIAAVPEAALPPPLGLADAMQQEANDDDEGEESECPVAEEVTSSNVVLLEQAERQARIQGTDAPVGDTSGVWARLAGLSVTSPPPTPTTFTFQASSRQRQGRRQTIGDFAQQPLVTSDVEVSSVDEILAQRQRLRRIQDRKRRRQTVAELNKRRSSWRGWMPAVDSPPSSPTGGVAHHAPPDWSTPHVSASEKETTLASSSSSSFHMYPPTAWNISNDRVLSPNRMRGFTSRVATALGMAKSRESSVELTNDPKHGSHDTQQPDRPAAVFAYPPRPVPIDADWETVDSPGDAPPQDVEERLSEAVEASQQVELYAVSAPASEVDNASLFGAQMPTEPEQELPAAQPQVLPAATNEHVLPAAKEQGFPVQVLPSAAKENALPAVKEEQVPASSPPPSAISVISPPTTRGKTNRIQRQQPASSSSSKSLQPPTNAMRHRAATTTAIAAATSTRKRKAVEPAQVPVKRGRPPIGTGPMRKTHESSVMSPPTTRSSKRKSHAA